MFGNFRLGFSLALLNYHLFFIEPFNIYYQRLLVFVGHSLSNGTFKAEDPWTLHAFSPYKAAYGSTRFYRSFRAAAAFQ